MAWAGRPVTCVAGRRGRINYRDPDDLLLRYRDFVPMCIGTQRRRRQGIRAAAGGVANPMPGSCSVSLNGQTLLPAWLAQNMARPGRAKSVMHRARPVTFIGGKVPVSTHLGRRSVPITLLPGVEGPGIRAPCRALAVTIFRGAPRGAPWVVPAVCLLSWLLPADKSPQFARCRGAIRRGWKVRATRRPLAENCHGPGSGPL